VVGEERYQDMPNKNKYSHPVEAAGYLMLGAGEGRALIKSNRPKPKVVEVEYGGSQSWMGA
jgi:hypothetical protein